MSSNQQTNPNASASSASGAASGGGGGGSNVTANVTEAASKFAGTMSKTFGRVVQFGQEKLGNAEKTELDFRFEQLSSRADKTKLQTEKLIKAVESYIEPNAGVRVQNFVNTKLNRPRVGKETLLEKLGSVMIETGEALGSDEQYGGALVRSGIVQQHVGEAWAEVCASATQKYLEPKHRFLNHEAKDIARLRSRLQRSRLDLDAAKSKLRRAQNGPAEKVAEAENQLRNSQWEFDEIYKETKTALENVTVEHDRQLIQLIEFMELQYEYFQNGERLMKDLISDLRKLRPTGIATHEAPHRPPPPYANVTATAPAVITSSAAPTIGRKAKIVYDHDANSDAELTVNADDIVTVVGEPVSQNGMSFIMIEARGNRGLVPSAFLEYFP